jgi:predicted metal-dependent enzyme (double-stranded beta helix superfamily)
MYAGQEDNVFYRRTPGGIEPTAARSLPAGQVVSLGPEVVHGVANPSTHGFAAGIHVYEGSYVDRPRTLWDPMTHVPGPATVAQSQAIFAGANAAATS